MREEHEDEEVPKDQRPLAVGLKVNSLKLLEPVKQKVVILFDVDMTGMPCGPNHEGSREGYFGENNIRYRRRLGRVVVAYYKGLIRRTFSRPFLLLSRASALRLVA